MLYLLPRDMRVLDPRLHLDVDVGSGFDSAPIIQPLKTLISHEYLVSICAREGLWVRDV